MNPAGMRIEPPPSPPVAMGSRPPATAAADPPDDPPGVRSGSHGLRVTPCSLVEVQLTPPNSDAVVWAASTAPAARSRATWVESKADIRSAKTSDASVNGQPSTCSSSLTPMGTPAEGERHVGRRGLGPGRVDVEVADGVQLGRLDGGQRRVEGLGRAEGPGPEGVDQRAGVLQPRFGHGANLPRDGRRARVAVTGRGLSAPSRARPSARSS